MASFDILRNVISMPSCSHALHSMIVNFLTREQHLNHGNRFRMSDVAVIAKERAYLEKIALKSFPNAISNYY